MTLVRPAVDRRPIRYELVVPGRRQETLEQLRARPFVDEVNRVPVALALAPCQPVRGIGPERAVDPPAERAGAALDVDESLPHERNADDDGAAGGIGDEGRQCLAQEGRERGMSAQGFSELGLDAVLLLAGVRHGDHGLDLPVKGRGNERVADGNEHLRAELANLRVRLARRFFRPALQDLGDPDVDVGLVEDP